MLTREENRLNLWAIKLLSYLHVIPLEFQEEKFTVPARDKRKWLVCVGIIALVQIRLLCFAVDTLLATLRGGSNLNTLSLDFVIICGGQSAVFAAAFNFILCPDITVSLCSNLSQGTASPNRRVGNWLRRYSYLELVTLVFPLVLCPGIVLLIGAHGYVYAWPQCFGWPLTLRCIFLLANATLMFPWTAWLYFTSLILVTSMEKFTCSLKDTVGKLKRIWIGSPTTLSKVRISYDKLRQLQVEVNAFNASQRFNIFAFKICLIGVATLGGFASLQFLETGLLLGAFNITVTCQALFVFTFIFDRGFAIPMRVKALQRLQRFLLKSANMVDETQRRILLRQLGSFGRIGIKVGDFHYLQRTSTPSFVDFCIKNAIRLAVAKRRNLGY